MRKKIIRMGAGATIGGVLGGSGGAILGGLIGGMIRERSSDTNNLHQDTKRENYHWENYQRELEEEQRLIEMRNHNRMLEKLEEEREDEQHRARMRYLEEMSKILEGMEENDKRLKELLKESWKTHPHLREKEEKIKRAYEEGTCWNDPETNIFYGGYKSKQKR